MDWIDQVTLAGVFVAVTVVLCAAAVLAHFGIMHLYLSGAEAIADDGLARGAPAPSWSLVDTAGNSFRSPPERPLQLVVFTDHSLKAFPSVVEGLKALLRTTSHPELIVLTRRSNDLARPMLDALGLEDIPVLFGSSELYGSYNVRVMPFVTFVDSGGRARAAGLVNYAWQIELLCRLANVAPEPDELQANGRPRIRYSRSGVK